MADPEPSVGCSKCRWRSRRWHALADVSSSGARLAHWLATPHHAEQFSAHFGAALSYALNAFDDERVRGFMRMGVLAQLAQIGVG